LAGCRSVRAGRRRGTIAVIRRGLARVAAVAAAIAVTIALAGVGIGLGTVIALALVTLALITLALVVLAGRARRVRTVTLASTVSVTGALALARIAADCSGDRIAGIIHGHVVAADGRVGLAAASAGGLAATAASVAAAAAAAAAAATTAAAAMAITAATIATTAANDYHVIVIDVIIVNDDVATMTTIDDHVVADNHVGTIIMDHGTMITIDLHARLGNSHVLFDHTGGHIGSLDWWSYWSRCDSPLEQRLTLSETVEVQAVQAAPVAFHDEQILRVVVAPDVGARNFDAVLVDDLELVAIFHDVRIADLHFNVQVLLRPCLCRCGRPGAGLILPRYSRVMPSAGAWIRSPCERNAAQNCCYRE
jgi:hypothetical protein